MILMKRQMSSNKIGKDKSQTQGWKEEEKLEVLREV